jgi:lipopolysaccharide export system permease protein
MNPDGNRFGQVFAQIEESRGASVVVAARGEQSADPATGDRSVRLFDGYRYFGTPGTADFDVVKFRELVLRLSPPAFDYINNQRAFSTTAELLASSDPGDQAELQSRLAAPLSVLILALLAVPLSHIRPRQSRYSKLVLGIVAVLVYLNLTILGTKWIGQGKIPAALGLWWLHALVLMVALWLIARRQGWLR